MKNIKATEKEVCALLERLKEDIKSYVIKRGGFINTQASSSTDPIYAYRIDYDFDEVEEYVVAGVRVKDNCLELAMHPKNCGYTYGIEEKDILDDDWYACGTNGDCILAAQTLLSIANSIEQY